jgi:CHAT domain-containing protein
VTDRGRRLYDLLVRPAEVQVERCQRLLILPDGPLHSLPFAALVRALPDGSTQYLVERRPVHLAMSATVFAELARARPSGDGRLSGAVTIFGDPDYPGWPTPQGSATPGCGSCFPVAAS